MYKEDRRVSYSYQNKCVEKDFSYELVPEFRLLTSIPKINGEGEED